jgi:D-xylose transport system substrate-binding protein
VWLAAAATAALTLIAAGCGGGEEEGAGEKPLVVFLLPENVTARWEGVDRPQFIEQMQKLVPDAEVQVQNALNDSSKQQQQAEAALTQGADVIVIAAVDAEAAAKIVNDADAEGVPVVAYDRLIKNSPLAYYDSFDSVAVGRAEAQAVMDNTQDGDRIVIINGATTDDNAHLVNQGIHEVVDPLIDSGARELAGEDWVPGWDPAKAQATMEQILTRESNDVQGVVSANDGMAGGIIAALAAQGLDGKVPVSGQDASLEGLQRVLLGTQTVSVFKDIRLQAEGAAKIVAAYLSGETPEGLFNGSVNNGQVDVPSVLLTVEPITIDNIQTLIDNGFVTQEDLCQGIPAGTGPC